MRASEENSADLQAATMASVYSVLQSRAAPLDPSSHQPATLYYGSTVPLPPTVPITPQQNPLYIFTKPRCFRGQQMRLPSLRHGG